MCLVILVLASAGWIFFVPGAQETLASLGINLPNAVASSQAAAIAPTNQPPHQRAGRGRTASVVTSPVVLATINDSLSAIGQGNAIRSVIVGAPAGGTLEQLLVSPGDTVTAGQIIGRLDSATEQIAFDKAKLADSDAQATLVRNQGLAQSNLVAGSALATVQLAADNARLGLRSAEIALQRRTITSPIAGTIGLMQVSPGNYLPAQTVITTIEDASAILIDFWVPQRYATSITPGMPIMASAIALPGRTFQGVVNAVDNRIDPDSRTLQVQARIGNADNAVRPGMSFNVVLRFEGEQFPAVNPLAIQWSTDGSFVWSYSDGKVHKVMAKIIQRNSDGVLVQGNLQPGDAIISEGVLQLREGMEVTLIDGPDGNGSAEAVVSTKPNR